MNYYTTVPSVLSACQQGLPLAPDTVESCYVSALVSLWEDQCLEVGSPYPNPRGPSIKALLDDLRIVRASLRRSAFEDRAIDGLKDGYTMEQARAMSTHLLEGLDGAHEEKTLRTRLDLLLLHSMMLRSESTRRAELADLCCLDLENEGTSCTAVVMHITRGKTIDKVDEATTRRTHYHGFIRHKEALLCPVGALAFWLFYRWEIFGEPTPDFSNRSSWYMTKILPGDLRRPQTAIHEQTEADWVRRVYAAAGIFSSKVLHLPRKAVARLMDLMELPGDQVRHGLLAVSCICCTYADNI